MQEAREGMKTKLENIRAESLKAIREAADPAGLDALRVQYLGKKGSLSAVLKQLGSLSAEERPQIGQMANEIRANIEEAIKQRAEALQSALMERKLRAEALDVTIPGKTVDLGARHPLQIVWDECVDIFIGMGFQVAEGPEIELSEYDFDKLNIPEGHTVREWTDTFYITEDEKVHLRCQTSPVQVRVTVR